MTSTIVVPFDLTRRGQRTFRYADLLAFALKARLLVHVPGDGETVSAEEEDGIRRRLAGNFHLENQAYGGLFRSFAGVPADGLVVGGSESDALAAALPRAARLLLPPGDSKVMGAANRFRLLLPFGNGPSGLRAADAAIAFARALAHPVAPEFRLYHTTWRDPALASDDPSAHMAEKTRDVLDQLTDRLKAAGFGFETTLETAETVVGGIARAALAQDADLVVMARGTRTSRGSYVSQLHERRCVPLLAVAPEAA